MKPSTIALALAVMACRGPVPLACADLTASLNDDSTIDVLWDVCTDDVARQITCTPAPPRYACTCYLDANLIVDNSFSDDIEQAMRQGDRDAILASSNAVCGYGLGSTAE